MKFILWENKLDKHALIKTEFTKIQRRDLGTAQSLQSTLLIKWKMEQGVVIKNTMQALHTYSSRVIWQRDIFLLIAQCLLVDSVLFFLCSQLHQHECKLNFFSKGINAGKSFPLKAREHPWEQHASLCERGRECVVMKVWLWMCRQCAGMPLCQLEFLCTCERDYVVISTIWELLPMELKLLASGSACTPKSLDQEAPDCCDLHPEDILWPPGFWFFFFFFFGCCSGFSAPGTLAKASTVHMSADFVTVLGHVSNHRGASCWLKQTVVLSSQGFPNHKSPLRTLLSQNVQALPHTTPGA